MKKRLLCFFLFASFLTFAQEDAWIYFADKPDIPFYLANPLEMLSQRALDRRTAQNIALDSKDVPVSVSYINQVSALAGITVMAKSKWLNALHVRGTVESIENLENFAFVESIQFANRNLNRVGRNSTAGRENAAYKELDIQINYNYGISANQIEMLNGNLLHQQDFTGTGKIIAIMDAGFPGVNTAAPFQRLLDNDLILGGYDFVNNSTAFFTGNSHGTLVLSTMGGYVENQLVGTAPDAQYYLFITEDVTSENPVEESYWVEAAELADSLGVDIINTSLGYFGYDNPNYSYSYQDMNGLTSFIARGADIAFSRGMICVTSAGNSGASANPNIGTPADAVNTLSVGAVTATRNYAFFSSVGPSFDGRIKPDVMAQGQAAVVSGISGSIGTANGTSFSGPIMAGMVASLWQALPDKTNAEIIQIVKESGHLYTNPNFQFGYGIPDFSLALSNALIINNPEKEKFLIYPNPVADVLNVVFPADLKTGEFSIYNAMGQLVLQKEISQSAFSFSLDSLNSGVYFYEIMFQGISKKGKLLKR